MGPRTAINAFVVVALSLAAAISAFAQSSTEYALLPLVKEGTNLLYDGRKDTVDDTSGHPRN